MISLIITLIILILVIILTIIGINTALKSAVDQFISKNENFDNYNNYNKFNNFSHLSNLDACKKLDKPLKETLNSQTGTNIPLNPIYYNNHTGNLNFYNDKINNDLKHGPLCVYQNELLYDGIWKSDISKKNNGFVNQHWILTKGNIYNDYLCSDKFVRLNKTLPEDYIDNTNIINNNEIDTSIYFNDKNDDPLDLQINCFPDQFDKKIVEGINNNFKDLGCI